jgi:hypothetical protein
VARRLPATSDVSYGALDLEEHSRAVLAPCSVRNLPSDRSRACRSRRGREAVAWDPGEAVGASPTAGRCDLTLGTFLLSFAWPQFADPSQMPSPEDLHDILPLLTPKQLANAIRGFAKQDVKPADDLMAAIASEVQSKLGEFRCGTAATGRAGRGGARARAPAMCNSSTRYMRGAC